MKNLFQSIRAGLSNLRTRPPQFTVSCSASGMCWRFTADHPDELAQAILRDIYAVSWPVARALAHAGFERGHGEYGRCLSIERVEG